jgi:glutamyl-tRNA synthetase
MLSVEDFGARLLGYLQGRGIAADAAVVGRAAPLVQERVSTLGQASEMIGFLLISDDEFRVDEDAAAKQLGETGRPVLEAALAALEPVTDWTAEPIEQALRSALVDGLGLKPRNAYGPVRVAVTGRTVSPPLFESLEILGRERGLARLRAALA